MSPGRIQHVFCMQLVRLEGHSWCCWPQVFSWRGMSIECGLNAATVLYNIRRALNFQSSQCRHRIVSSPACWPHTLSILRLYPPVLQWSCRRLQLCLCGVDWGEEDATISFVRGFPMLPDPQVWLHSGPGHADVALHHYCDGWRVRHKWLHKFLINTFVFLLAGGLTLEIRTMVTTLWNRWLIL